MLNTTDEYLIRHTVLDRPPLVMWSLNMLWMCPVGLWTTVLKLLVWHHCRRHLHSVVSGVLHSGSTCFRSWTCGWFKFLLSNELCRPQKVSCFPRQLNLSVCVLWQNSCRQSHDEESRVSKSSVQSLKTSVSVFEKSSFLLFINETQTGNLIFH